MRSSYCGGFFAAMAVVGMAGSLLVGCGGGGGGGRNGGSLSVNQGTVGCGGTDAQSLPRSAGLPPAFGDGRGTRLLQITGVGGGTGSIEITVDSSTGNVDLYLGAPGTPAGATGASSYYFSSADPTALDRLRITPAGVSDVSGNLDTTYTLADFLAAGADPVFAVCATGANTSYQVSVACLPPTSSVECGRFIQGTVPGSFSSILPNFSSPSEIVFHELPPFSPTAEEVVLDLRVNSGDAHLFLAAPGVSPGSTDPLDYPFCSCAAGSDRITMQLTGITELFGGSYTGVTLADYLAAPTPISFLVAGYDTTTDYDLVITCFDPNVLWVRDAPCGETFPGVEIDTSTLGSPDLTNLRTNHFYRVTNRPPGGDLVSIWSSGSGTGSDTHIWMAAPGVAPGSQTFGDYVYSSIQPAPFEPYEEDNITLVPSGIASFFTQSGTPSLAQYDSSGQDIGFVINGRLLAGSPSYYDITVDCTMTPAQATNLIACGGSASGTLTGRFLSPPDYYNPAETIFYEIDGSTIPVGATSIVISCNTLQGDCDVYLAAPDVVPGVPAMIFASLLPQLDTDGVTMDATGLYSPPGSWPTSTADWVLNDYLGASQNISFAIHSWDGLSDYSLSVTCN